MILKGIVKQLALAVGLFLFSALGLASDWPQLQKDAARTGRTTDSVAPPYRARWIWLGPTLTLRNQHSEAGWTDDLDTRDGYSYPMPASVNLAISYEVQPVLANGRVFVGSIDGYGYGIDAANGSTLWTAAIPGGTICSAACSGNTVVFSGLTGTVSGVNAANGTVNWTFQCAKTVTCAPCVADGIAYIGDHKGYIYALSAETGQLLWQSVRLSASVQGGLAADENSVYVGTEDMWFRALNRSDGTIRASIRVRGQSFRSLYPVIFNNIVYVHSTQTPMIGAEYMMEDVEASSSNLSNEESNIQRWLSGDDNGGQWNYASQDWKHIFALRTSNLTEAFPIAAGPADGCGSPTQPAVIDNSNRVLTYFKTKYPTLTTAGPVFGSNYSMDIAAINQTTGARIPIDNGHFCGIWMIESDNLYAMSVAGNYLWLRQDFRGTQVINLANSTYEYVTAQVRYLDGGQFNVYVVYVNNPPAWMSDNYDAVQTSMYPYMGRSAPIVVGSRVYLTESFGVTCIEHTN